MLDRIERVTRVKGVGYEAERRFDRKEGYKDKGGNKNFSEMLTDLKRKAENSTDSRESEAYSLELSDATRMLYFGGLDYKTLLEKIAKEKGVGG